jgi:hypothetical protein
VAEFGTKLGSGTVIVRYFVLCRTRMIPGSPRTLTLKQRLAALTQNQESSSSPSSPIDTSPKSPSIKRRFTVPWVKRPPSQNSCRAEFVEEERLQLIISKMIYQAGVDYECVYRNLTAQSLTCLWTERAQCNANIKKLKCGYSTLLSSINAG